MPEDIENKYWFGFRQTYPKPPGKAIACGPYDSYEEAKKERNQSKAWDCNVSVPFIADTKKEAEEKAERFT